MPINLFVTLNFELKNKYISNILFVYINVNYYFTLCLHSGFDCTIFVSRFRIFGDSDLNPIAMKTISTLLLTSLITLTMSAFRVCYSQTVATGHVSAEVVESVSASSTAITSFEIGSITAGDTKAMEQTYLTSNNIDLGTITVHSGNNITCNVVVLPALLTDAAGNGFTLAPSIQNNTFASAAQPNGSQTMELGGKTSMARNQASGLYQGSYTVVFAYN